MVLLLLTLFIVTPIVGVCNCSMFCCALLYVHSSIAIILMGKRELVALLNLSSWCLVMVERLFLAVPRDCLQFVIVVFPDHTHLLFLVEVYWVMLHTQYKGSRLFGSRQEDFHVFLVWAYVKHVTVRGHCWPQGQNLNILSRGLLGDATS